MTDPWVFTLAALALLAAPGPTNTLLATSAASAGALRSLSLVLASALGYVVATLIVAIILAPLADASRALDIGMRVACCLYLLFAAWRLWLEGDAINDGDPLQFHRVLIASSLNPKGIVLATIIVPHMSPLNPTATPYLLGLAAVAIVAATAWVAIGASLRTGARLDARLARRIGAGVLVLFAVIVAASALSV